MRVVLPAVLGSILLMGCGSTSSTSTPEEGKQSSISSPAAAPPRSEPAVSKGMSMSDVKKLRGAPTDTKHEHGPNGSEIDIWIYSNQTIRFENGKVAD